jgi:hypothetical protein
MNQRTNNEDAIKLSEIPSNRSFQRPQHWTACIILSEFASYYPSTSSDYYEFRIVDGLRAGISMQGPRAYNFCVDVRARCQDFYMMPSPRWVHSDAASRTRVMARDASFCSRHLLRPQLCRGICSTNLKSLEFCRFPEKPLCNACEYEIGKRYKISRQADSLALPLCT